MSALEAVNKIYIDGFYFTKRVTVVSIDFLCKGELEYKIFKKL